MAGVADLVSPSQPEMRDKIMKRYELRPRPGGAVWRWWSSVLSREACVVSQAQDDQSEDDAIDDENRQSLHPQVPDEPCDRRVAHHR